MSRDLDPCPLCGRSGDDVARLRSSIRARSLLINEAHRLGLNAFETADLLAGLRTFADPGQQDDTDTNGVTP